MRPLEIILCAVIAAALILLLYRPRRPLPRALALLPLPILVAHATVEGMRWQLVPVYLLTLIIVTLSFGLLERMRFNRIVATIGLVVVVLSALLALALPVASVPKPSGPYQVGTTTLNFTDESRAETYSDDPSDRREVIIQIWYPTNATTGEIAPVVLEAEKYAPAFAAEFGMPAFVMSHVGLIRSNSRVGVPIRASDSPYPVVVGSHGWRGFRALHTTQFEELASQGYIAVGIDHPYGAMTTVLQDGRAVRYNPAALPEGVADDVYDRASEALEQTYAADIRFVLDRLEELNSTDQRFRGQLDLERLGLFGHSTGGGAMVQTCQNDPRCKAGLAMDGWVEPIPAEQRSRGVTQPFMFMRSEPWTRNDNDAVLSRMYDASSGQRYRLAIAGTSHRDYTLQGLLSPLLPLIGFAGDLPTERMLTIVDAYMLAFFNQTLRGESSPLLEGPSAQYSEVTFERNP